MEWVKAAAVAAIALELASCATVRAARNRIVRAPPACDDRSVQIYFESDSADVTPEGHAVIREAAWDARSCPVKGVEVVGLADAAGDPRTNLELSRRRAQSVTAALEAAGLPPAEFRMAAAGDAGAQAADGRAAPLRRRAEIILHLGRR